MTDTPNDDEFREIHVDSPEAADPETVTEPTPEPAADEPASDPDAPADGGEDGKPEGEAKPENEKPLRDESGKFKGGVQGRIDELTKARREAERTAAYWQGIATRNGAEPGKDAAPTSKPSADDFEDYGDYVEALTDWKVQARERSNIDTRATEAAQVADTHRAAEWNGKLGAAKATIADFDAVMETANAPTLPHVAQAIMDADRGPELLYHLAKYPALVETLNDMSPYRAAMELGRIEANLPAPAAAPAPREVTTSRAPAPITPVQAGSTVAKDPSKMNMDEYKAFRTAQGIR